MKYGSHGVVLESIRTPRLATTRQAVARFSERLSEVYGAASAASRDRGTRRNSNQNVEMELERLGI